MHQAASGNKCGWFRQVGTIGCYYWSPRESDDGICSTTETEQHGWGSVAGTCWNKLWSTPSLSGSASPRRRQLQFLPLLGRIFRIFERRGSSRRSRLSGMALAKRWRRLQGECVGHPSSPQWYDPRLQSLVNENCIIAEYLP